MKAPWFPFYCGDFLASSDVQLMEAHEVGAYVLLLTHSWQSNTPGYLPNDEGRLRRLARLSAEAWKESRDLLLGKWPVAEDAELRYNPRLLKEAEKQVELRELKAEAGRKSAERRAQAAAQRQQTGNTNPTPVENTATDAAQNGNYSQPQSQPQSQEGKPSSSLRSEGAADAAAPPEKKIGDEPPTEQPQPIASHTEGAAADVGTSVKLTKQRGGKKPKPAPASTSLADYELPEWADDQFRTDAAEWLVRRQARTDVRPLQPAAVQEYFTELAGYTADFCQQLFRESRKHPDWQGLTFRSTPMDFTRHMQQLQQLQANAARPIQSANGLKPNGTAAADVAEFLVRRRFQQPGGTAGHPGQTTGTYPGQGPVGAPGFGAN